MAGRRLVWKWEEGFESGETPVGPAWLDSLGEDGKTEYTEQVAGGEWISRDDAIRLAGDNGYDLLLDE